MNKRVATAKIRPPRDLLKTRFKVRLCRFQQIPGERANASLQLRRAISIQAEGKKTTWEACYRAVSCKALFDVRGSQHSI